MRTNLLLLGWFLSAFVTAQPFKAPHLTFVGSDAKGNFPLSSAQLLMWEEPFTGPGNSNESTLVDTSIPTSISAADFDEDGVIDLLVGYAAAEGGQLILFRGNVDSQFPNTPEAQQRRLRGESSEFPFLPDPTIERTEAVPRFLAAGDFDADGHFDMVVAGEETSFLYLFRGTGKGTFQTPEEISIPGRVTTLEAGEIQHRDGLTDLAIGVSIATESWLLIFQSPQGALRTSAQVYGVPGPVHLLAIADLDGDFSAEVAAVSGDSLLLLQFQSGESCSTLRNRPSSSGILASYPLSFTPMALEAVDLLGDDLTELALLATDGQLFALTNLVDPAGTSPVTHLLGGIDRETRDSSLRRASSSSNLEIQLVKARVSASQKEDLIVVDPSRFFLEVLVGGTGQEGKVSMTSSEKPSPLQRVDLRGPPAAVLPLRLNEDALSDLAILGVGTQPLTFALSAPLASFSVNSTGNDDDRNPGDGLCSDESGKCTLQAAIQEANSTAGLDWITFNSLGSFSQIPVIQVDSLDQATTPVFIDGTSSPAGAVELRGDVINLQGGNSTLRGFIAPGVSIALAGSNYVEGNDLGSTISFDPGVTIARSDGNIIGGTVPAARNHISGSMAWGIVISESSGNKIQGNYIGTDETGNLSRPNRMGGVSIMAASGNTIGGTESGAGNVVSGQGQTAGIGSAPFGIQISVAFSGGTEVASQSNLIQGNLIGLTADGKSALGNGVGVSVLGSMATNNLIGGSTPAARNIISGNVTSEINYLTSSGDPGKDPAATAVFGGWAINLGGECHENCIVGNFIGTDESGEKAIPNESNGILISGSSDNLIRGNRIAHNKADGILIVEANPPNQPVQLALSNTITENSIFSNDGLGINLVGGADEDSNGVTPNDPGGFLNNAPDQDTGPNNLQNFPTELELGEDGGALKGKLSSTPFTQFRIEFFANSNCDDPSGHGEGAEFLGVLDYSPDRATDSLGLLEFTAPFSVPEGKLVTATATDPAGNTSEFSPCSAAASGIRLTPYVVLGMAFCGNATRDLAVHDLATGNEITTESNVSFRWVDFDPNKGTDEKLPRSLVDGVINKLKEYASDILPPIAQIDVIDGKLQFKSEGVNVLQAVRTANGKIVDESNYAFVIGGMKVLETASLEIAPFSLTSLFTNTRLAEHLTDSIAEGICRIENRPGCSELQVDAPMILFPDGQDGIQCGGKLTELGSNGQVIVKSLKFDFFGGLIEDVDLLEALGQLGIGVQLLGDVASLGPPPFGQGVAVGLLWLSRVIKVAHTVGPFALSQLLDFEVSSKAASSKGGSPTEDAIIRVSNSFSLSPPFIKGSVKAKESGFSAVQATLDLDTDDFCPGKATTLMPVWVLPDLEQVEIRNPDWVHEDPMGLLVGQDRQATSVGIFEFNNQAIQFDPFGLGSGVQSLAEKLLPSSLVSFIGGFSTSKKIQFPTTPAPVDGFYREGGLFFEGTATLTPYSLNLGSFRVQIPTPNLPLLIENTWEIENSLIADVSSKGVLTGNAPGETKLDLEVCVLMTSPRKDLDGNKIVVVDTPTIWVQKFEDKNLTQRKNASDPGVNGWQIRLERLDNGDILTGTTGDFDLDGNGTIDPATERGIVFFRNLEKTYYKVTELGRSDWVRTTEPSSFTFHLDQKPFGFASFGNFRHMQLWGHKFEDLNGNGKDDGVDKGEGRLEGWEIEIDLHKDGIVDLRATTDKDGDYFFSSIPPGDFSSEKSFVVREVLKPGWVQTTPGSPREFKIESGLSEILHFGNFKLMRIDGIKFHDLNGDGKQDSGEPPLAGWRIQLDLHSDGSTDEEKVTDSQGRFRFDAGPGDPNKARTFILKEIEPAGWTRTTPRPIEAMPIQSGLIHNTSFGNFRNMKLGGVKYLDANHDGIRQANETGLAGWVIELDLNVDGTVDATATTDSDGRYLFQNVGPGDPSGRRQFTIRERQQPGWSVSQPPSGIYTVDFLSGLEKLDFDFGNWVGDFDRVKICGAKFEDLNANGVWDTTDPQNMEPGLAGWVIRLKGPEGEVEQVTGAGGVYCFDNVGPGNFVISEALKPGWIRTFPKKDESHKVTTETGKTVEGLNFGNFKLGMIAGSKFNDLNGDKLQGPDEPSLPGWTIYIDGNNDGQLNNPAGDGLCSAGATERCTQTSPDGSYAFRDLTKGGYILREVQQEGWEITTDESLSVTIAKSGQILSNLKFGNREVTSGQIGGSVFFDLDGDGVRDSDETGVPGWLLYVDLNYNGNLDSTESQALTDAGGNYIFNRLEEGTYIIRQVGREGWRSTFPTGDFHEIQMTGASSVLGVDFGNVLETSHLLMFPYFQGDSNQFTGFAFSNYSDQSAYLNLSAFDPVGNRTPLGRNPTGMNLDAQNQTARLGSELFEVNPATPRGSWVKVLTDNPKIASFFLFGGSKAPMLDGSVAFTEQLQHFFFTRVLHGSAAFKGKAVETWLSIANPNSSPITLELTLIAPISIGFELGSTPAQDLFPFTTVTIPGDGVLFKSVDDLFGGLQLAEDVSETSGLVLAGEETLASYSSGIIEVHVTEGQGAIGFELIKIPGAQTAFGLNAQVGNSGRSSYSAQLASAPSIFTNLKLVNTSLQDRQVTIHVIAENGEALAPATTFELGPFESLERDIDQIVEFESSAPILLARDLTTSAIGSIHVQADGPGIIGDVVFGDPVGLKFAAAMPLQTATFTEALFSQVANVTGFFTGLALFNPGLDDASITISVFAENGEQAGESSVTLPAGQRLARTLVELVPRTAGQARGFIYITSSQPIVSQQLFGDSNLNLLSAVPPTVVVGGSIDEPDLIVVEEEPNDELRGANPILLGQTGRGVLDPEGDRDLWRFEGTEGQSVTFEVVAASQGSALDSFLAFFINEDRDGDGFLDELAADDDGGNAPDSKLRIDLPETNTYIIMVIDYFESGGPNFFYDLLVYGGAGAGTARFPLTQSDQLEPGDFSQGQPELRVRVPTRE